MEILTSKFKCLITDELYNRLTGTSNNTFHMIGADPTSNGTVVTPTDSVFEGLYDLHDQMLFAKRITSDDVRYMIRNIPWVSGSEYDVYDDKVNLDEKDYYVVAEQSDGSYGVFKCLYKTPIVEPKVSVKPSVLQTGADDEMYMTGDGYQWKYMFTISAVDYAKFATSGYVPVTVDSNVTANAVSGSIDGVIIEDPGSGYNNYASGTIKESVVDGNTKKYKLESDTFFQVRTFDLFYLTDTSNTFSEGDLVDILVDGVETANNATIYKTGPSSVSFQITGDVEDITQATLEAAANTIVVTDGTITAQTLLIRPEIVPQLSNQGDFYNGSLIYIRYGTGAGQTRTITDYQVVGNDRIAVIDTDWSIIPDTTSTFSILPKIEIDGDGTGFVALPVIDTTANSIVNVHILDRGSGYTYATATVVGNTGITDANGSIINTNEATIRPTIAPLDGHGAHVIQELRGHNIGISVDFANTDVRTDIAYNKIAIIQDMVMDNVILTLDAIVSNSDFTVGETVTQADLYGTGEITDIDSIGNTITLTNVRGSFYSGNTVVGSSTNAVIVSINTDTDLFDNTRTLSITPTSGSIEVGETITQDNTGARAYVIDASASEIVATSFFNTFNTTDTIRGDSSGATCLMTSITGAKVVDNSGDVLYIENTSEITRSDATQEKIKVVITL